MNTKQNELLETTIKFKETPEIDSMPILQNIPKNIAPVERPNKQEAIETMCSRFKI